MQNMQLCQTRSSPPLRNRIKTGILLNRFPMLSGLTAIEPNTEDIQYRIPNVNSRSFNESCR
jgi:hypothetical protein